ncbi:MAG: hypothetical protein AB7F19_07665 [Candidatus Babeliales bacterium]
MWSLIGGFFSGLFAKLIGMWTLYRMGKMSASLESKERDNAIYHKMLDEANNAPSSRDDFVKRVQRDGL